MTASAARPAGHAVARWSDPTRSQAPSSRRPSLASQTPTARRRCPTARRGFACLSFPVRPPSPVSGHLAAPIARGNGRTTRSIQRIGTRRPMILRSFSSTIPYHSVTGVSRTIASNLSLQRFRDSPLTTKQHASFNIVRNSLRVQFLICVVRRVQCGAPGSGRRAASCELRRRPW